MGYVSPISCGNGCYLVARLGQRLQRTYVGVCARGRLYVREPAVEDPLGAIYPYLLDRIEVIAPLVVPLPRESLCISSMEVGVACPPDHRAEDVLACYHR